MKPTIGSSAQLRFGANLRTQRNNRRLSQEAFADLLGIHRTYIGDLERGRRPVGLVTVGRLADRLGLSADQLLAGD